MMKQQTIVVELEYLTSELPPSIKKRINCVTKKRIKKNFTE